MLKEWVFPVSLLNNALIPSSTVVIVENQNNLLTLNNPGSSLKEKFVINSFNNRASQTKV